jgi:hypothetical protein
MKTLLAFILTSFACLPLFASDIRVVNGIRVDLQPIWDWTKAKAEGQEDLGDRPMPHWKFFMILEVKQQMMGGWLCAAKDEQAKPVDIVVLNLPRHVTQLLQKINSSTEQEAVMSERAAKMEATAALADAVAPTTAFGSEWYVYNALAARAQANLMKIQAAEATRAAQSVTAAREYWEQLKQKGETSILAMPTGRKVGRYPILDVGQSTLR